MAVTTDRTWTTPERSVRRAEESISAGRRVVAHVQTEFTNDTDQILATVAHHLPLAYAVGVPDEAGHSHVDAFATRDGAAAHYDLVREAVDILAWEPFTEIRNDWFVFFDGIVTQRPVGASDTFRQEAIVLFPMGPEEGIQGELAWSSHVPRPQAPRQSTADPDPAPVRRAEVLAAHGRLLDAYRAGDVDGVLAEMADEPEVAFRDMVGGAPYGARLGRAAVAEYFGALFDAFEVHAVDAVNTVIGDWFAFSELRWEVATRSGPAAGRHQAFCWAAMMPLDADGRVLAQLGYATDLVDL